MTDNKKSIWRTAGITLLSLIVIFVAFYLVMLFCFTEKMADFYYNLGCENISASLYHRVYEKNDDIYYIYRALNLEISQEDNAHIIEYFEEFCCDDEYLDFCAQLQKHNEDCQVNILEKSILLDEVNSLKNFYVQALVKGEVLEKAKEYAIGDFAGVDSVSLTNIGDFTLGKIMPLLSEDDINKVYEGYDLSLISAVQNYFDKCVVLFEGESDLSTDLEKSYLLRLGNRIVTTGSALNGVYSQYNLGNIDANVDKMESVNNKIMELLKK